MEPRAMQPAYTATQRALHWITALAVITLLAAALAMNSVAPGPLMNRLYVLHWSLGVSVFPLTLWRLAIRFSRPTPPLPDDMPGWQHLAAHANHVALYAILLVNPILGYFTKSAFGGPVEFFWLVDFPPVIAKNEPLFHQLSQVHVIIGFAMIAIIAVHIAAALYHGIVRRDGILTRMATG